MNRKKAYQILGLNDEKEYSETEIKKQYRSKILQYHPDKNSSADAAEKFIEVQDAYNVLQSSGGYENESYREILKSFLSSVLREETDVPLIHKLSEIICKKICLIIDHNADAIIEYLCNINRDTLQIVYSILSKYRHILHFSEELIRRVEELLEVNECIVLNPTLEDLMSNENVYILKNNGKSYLVPLWHHETIFDCSESGSTDNRKLIVKTFPLLPDNMELDDCNILTISLRYHLHEIWNREVVVDVGGVPFIIRGKELKMTDLHQTIKYENCGVPYNNTDDIFDCSRRQPVIFFIRVLQ
jgi:hypothetical protein